MTATLPYPRDMDPEQKTFGGFVGTLAAGENIVVPAAGMSALTVIPDTGATVVITRVDSMTGTPSGDAWDQLATAAAETVESNPVDWPYYYLACSGGTARWSLV